MRPLGSRPYRSQKPDAHNPVNRPTARTCSGGFCADGSWAFPERSGSYPDPEWGCQPPSGLADHLAEAGAELIAPDASTIELGEQSFTFTDALSLPCGSCVTAAIAVADSAPSGSALPTAKMGCRPEVRRGLRREL